MSQPPFRVVFMSGARGSGKKTAAKIIADTAATGPYVIDAFLFEMRERCHAAFKLFDPQRLPVHPLYFEESLDVPLGVFHGTPRAAYARFAQFARDVMGPQVEGDWVAGRLRYFRRMQQEKLERGMISKVARGTIIVDMPQYTADSVVYRPIVDYVGAENCTVLHIERAGSGIAQHICLDGVRGVRVRNPGDSVAAFETAIRKAAPHLYIEIAQSLSE